MPRCPLSFTRAGLLALGLVAWGTIPISCASSSSPAPSSPATPTPAPSETAPEEAPEEATAAGLADSDPALACRLVRQEGAVLLDVRTPEEFAEGHVEGAKNIPHDQIDARAAELDELQGGDKTTPIVVYCRSGRRAGVAKQSLIDGGRTQVTNLGGLSDWPECPS